MALLTASFDPVIGGAETYALNLAEGLTAVGHEVMVITDTPHGMEPGAADPGPRPYRLARLWRYRGRLFDQQKLPWEEMAFSLASELEAHMDAFRPDVLVSNSLDTALQAAMIRRSTPGLAWAAAFHEHAPQDEPFGDGRMAVVYGDLRPDAVLAGSQFYAERARTYGPAEAVHLIHHGVPVPDVGEETTAAWRARYRLSDRDLMIACVGRLKPRKGMSELIEAFASLRPRERRLRLVIAGTVSSASQAYADGLKSLADRLGCADLVTFDETVVAAQVPALFSAADLVAQPSHEEGLGLAVLEGMAARRPVVTTRVAGINEIVTRPDVAVQVEAHDPKALAAALERLLTDAGARKDYAEAGFAHVRDNFSLPVMVSRTADVLALLARSSTACR
ncbi:glycosyltransferase family 4 protein [Streptomyces griseoloalbus]|uniref:D-inositol 3-phosphate glycosyltransferase n=1 Tax=Streptomyces griseoloalbus TaxID=67303 RepID=A0A7W8BR96_9ACTN|nr:glycosyltransferase family 4 protein [Streptomyces albaduncus]MBB5128139.1 glycosyltransferase involved in cell wall biosynthesis [Streptomyces albaduncus]